MNRLLCRAASVNWDGWSSTGRPNGSATAIHTVPPGIRDVAEHALMKLKMNSYVP